MKSKTRNLILFICFFLILVPGFSQGLPGGGVGGGGNRIEGKVKFMPIPYINYDRSIGLTLGALPMLMFNPVDRDTLSPSSVAGAMGMWTTNGTWFGVAFTKLHLKEDNWRLTAAGGLGAINFQFYLDNPVDMWIPYTTEANFLVFKAERRVYRRIYAGASYSYVDFLTSTENLPIEQRTILNGLGLSLSIDQRNVIYYPSRGFISNINYNTYPDFLGNDAPSNKVEVDHNHYFSARNRKDVVAGRFYSGLGIGDLTFNQQFIVGRTDIRGYSQGAFRGNYQLAVQGEYRWNFHERLGLVGFLGVATIFDGVNESDNGRLLPGIGSGFRVTIQEDTQFKVGMDIAAGINDWSIEFRIGEAF